MLRAAQSLPMQYSLTDHDAREIQLALQTADAQAAGQDEPLPAALLASTHDAEWPLWLRLCHAALVCNRFMPTSTVARRRIAGHLAGWAPPTGATGAQGTSGLRFEPAAKAPADAPASHGPIDPAQAAALAIGCADPGWPAACQPATAEEQLLVDAYEGRWPPPGAATLDLTQMLVQDSRGAMHSGRLGRLQLWLLPEGDGGPMSAGGQLLRAPGAALLQVDAVFAEGLARVQRLLGQVLQRGAPGVAWSLRPLPSTDAPEPAPLLQVLGPSATAALAYGALYLLRDHLQPALADVADWLHDAEPATISITAGLDGPAWGADPAAPFRWPQLVRVGGVDDKFAALDRALPQRPVTHRYVAHDQQAAGHLPPRPPVTLDGLIAQVAADANGGLDADARRLHRLLAADDAPVTDRQLLAAVAASTVRPTSLKGLLVRRYAVRASGSHAAFGDPVRLDQHYQRLVLARRDSDDEPDRAARQRPPEAPEEFELRHLLHTHPHNQVPAWCVEAPPFCGKTTLLAEREATTARAALQSHRRQGVWGEVSVFLPMKGFRDRPPLPEDARAAQRQAVEQAFIAFIQRQAPGLPPLDDWLAQPASTGAGDAPPGLQLRLLIDGLNELPADGFDERRRVMGLLCSWLARHRGPLLAPVFTVRVQENGLDLAADDGTDWRARTATLLPWRRSDWRDYIGLRGLQPQAQERLHTALRLHLTDAHGQADDTPFEAFCRSPGILAAQCTLLERWPALVPPQRRGTLFLALLWHCLQQRGSGVPDKLLPQRLRGQAALQQAAERGWQLPAQPGLLIDQLRRQADVMHDDRGQPLEQWPAEACPPGLQGDDALAWRAAVTRLGLAAEDFDGQFGFLHQQWREFFAALGAGLQKPLPDLRPPPLNPPPGQPLLDHVAKEGTRLELPAVTPHQERIRFAVQLSSHPDAWVRRLMTVNLPLAARVAIDHLQHFEPGEHWKGTQADEPQRHPLLQHLRRLLLLRSMDAGAVVQSRLRAGAVIGDSLVQAALAAQMPGFDDELDAHWARVWAGVCQGEGVDVRQRLEAGFLLGELGDTLRYERVTVDLPDGTQRTGLRLRDLQWASLGERGGPKQWFRVGTDDGGGEDEWPSRLVDFDPFQVARYPVTVGEWRWFVESGGYANPDLPWWRAAGPAACEWLVEQGRPGTRGELGPAWALGHSDLNNALQPMALLRAYEVLAFAAWATALAGNGAHFKVPTEDRWESAVRGAESAQQERQSPDWSHVTGHAGRGPFDFNHRATGVGRISPVGCFGRSAATHGVFDAAGNVWEWCASPPDAPGVSMVPRSNRDHMALRGGAFNDDAVDCRPAVRAHDPPGRLSIVGVRLVRLWLPHSGPRTP